MRVELNGRPATPDDLRHPALVNYGHFTSMQVQGRAVRGLDLHLARLDASTRELFGCALDTEIVREYLRSIVGDDDGALSLRVNVFSRALDRDRLAQPAPPDVLVTTGPARAIDARPSRVKTFRYERVLPHVKHVGTFALFHHRRLAQLEGFDDALFADARGYVSEGSIWNVGFFDGESVVWPQAPMLDGISMQLLKQGLAERGVASVVRPVSLNDLATFRGAFFTNSALPVQPIAAIDGVEFEVDPNLIATLRDCYALNAPQPL